ncbi:hypothetical protein HFTV1-gp65 [Haloferax tailed virus 1]|uniref:Uncharacterized protein n=1 Tax=Haloferax tailed virus 1 TaxID=2507575 RepID=A0A410N6X2_HFTV1|nr:hypothetical protein M1M17_gp65 [Haloferax tailed virus 1]QAS68898.1 hypothetical protein HFTV1-gp65 [Haloferax tailed virus 1]
MSSKEPFEWVDDDSLRSVKDVFDRIQKAHANELGINMSEDEIPTPVAHGGSDLQPIVYADGWGELRDDENQEAWIASSAGFVNLGDCV